jgi:hypothetical protein
MALDTHFPAGMTDFLLILQRRVNTTEDTIHHAELELPKTVRRKALPTLRGFVLQANNVNAVM